MKQTKRIVIALLLVLAICCTMFVACDFIGKKTDEHTYELIAERPATCTEDGVAEHYFCAHCEKNYIKDGETYMECSLDSLKIPAAHTYNKVAKVAETCTTAGVAEHYECTACHKLFAQIGGAYVEKSASYFAIEPHAHAAAQGATWASDTQTHWHVCAECGVAHADTANHTLDVTAPKTITDTTHSGTCAVCGAAMAEEAHYAGVDADWIIGEDADAGYHWKECEVCGAIVPETKALHSAQDDQLYYDLEEGVEFYLCVCGERVGEKAHEHAFNIYDEEKLAFVCGCGEEYAFEKQRVLLDLAENEIGDVIANGPAWTMNLAQFAPEAVSAFVDGTEIESNFAENVLTIEAGSFVDANGEYLWGEKSIELAITIDGSECPVSIDFTFITAYIDTWEKFNLLVRPQNTDTQMKVGYFVQTADIQVPVSLWDARGNNTAGGKDVNFFSGYYDGQNYWFTMKTPASNCIGGDGLFGCVTKSTIKNVRVSAPAGDWGSGVISGQIFNTVVENVYAQILVYPSRSTGAANSVAYFISVDQGCTLINCTCDCAGLSVPETSDVFNQRQTPTTSVMDLSIIGDMTFFTFSQRSRGATELDAGLEIIVPQIVELASDSNKLALGYAGYTLVGADIDGTDVLSALALNADGELTIDGTALSSSLSGSKVLNYTLAKDDEQIQRHVVLSFATKVIRTVDDLRSIRWDGTYDHSHDIDGYYVLDSDIDCEGAKFTSGCTTNTSEFAPWTDNWGFMGTFDGQGHKISNFTVGAGGLFGMLNDLKVDGVIKHVATIQNIVFDKVSYADEDKTALIAYTVNNNIVIKNLTINVEKATQNINSGLLTCQKMAAYATVKNIVVNAEGLTIGNITGTADWEFWSVDNANGKIWLADVKEMTVNAGGYTIIGKRSNALKWLNNTHEIGGGWEGDKNTAFTKYSESQEVTYMPYGLTFNYKVDMDAFNQSVSALPEVANATVLDWIPAKSLKTTYDNLSAEDKALVTDSAKLLAISSLNYQRTLEIAQNGYAWNDGENKHLANRTNEGVPPYGVCRKFEIIDDTYTYVVFQFTASAVTGNGNIEILFYNGGSEAIDLSKLFIQGITPDKAYPTFVARGSLTGSIAAKSWGVITIPAEKIESVKGCTTGYLKFGDNNEQNPIESGFTKGVYYVADFYTLVPAE